MDLNECDSEVASFYDNQNVFITGATGFIGKALVEKLLYSCSGVKMIYVLIRPRNIDEDVPSKNRFQELLESQIFQRLRDEKPNALTKIIPVWGDITCDRLGISTEMENKLKEEVSIVFHCAATTKFNEPLKIAIEANLIGTKNVLEFFKKLKIQKSLVFVSTAFANCQRKLIEETVYPMLVEPNFQIYAKSILDTKTLEYLTESVLDGRPNTYTATKAAAEQYLEEQAGDLPVAIMRPSIVENALNEPSKGWRDANSILFLCTFAIAKGLIHNLPVKHDARLDMVPLDMAVNLTIVVAWHTTVKRERSVKLPVYNFVSGNGNPLTFEKYRNCAIAYGLISPYGGAVNYVYIRFTTNKILLTFGKYLDHYFPAAMIDFVLLFAGKKPKYLNMYRRYFSAIPMQTFFMERHFNFKSDNVESLYKQLSSVDKKVFNFDIASFDWTDYLPIMLDGMRRYKAPEDFDIDLKIRQRRMKLFYWRYIFVNISISLSVLYLAYLIFL